MLSSNKVFSFLRLKALNNFLNIIIFLFAFSLKANILLFFFLNINVLKVYLYRFNIFDKNNYWLFLNKSFF